MAEIVYVLCAVTSIACAALLWRGWRASRMKLLFWASLCFAGLAVNNVLLYVDLVLAPTPGLAVTRSLVAVASLGVLLFGLIWETK